MNLNVWLILHNSIPFGKKFANNNKFNVFVFGNGDNYKEINVYWNNSFWNIFWSWNDFKFIFFHPTNTFFDIKICDLIQKNIEI